MNTKHFALLDEAQLLGTRGGGFAYDVGRVLRFIGISLGGNPIGTNMNAAIVDWQINELINDAG